MRLLVTRPEPDATRQAERLVELGHQPVVAPLLGVEFIPDVRLDLDGVSALIATSRNAIRALASHPQAKEALHLPLFATGAATASEAERLGFANITTGPGTGRELAALIAARRRGTLLHLAGEILAFDLKSALEKEGFSVRRPVLYRTVAATELPKAVVAAIETGAIDGVILMSPRTASIFTRLVRAQGLATPMSRVNCYCISQAVAQELAPLRTSAIVAAHPSEDDVLALLATETAS